MLVISVKSLIRFNDAVDGLFRVSILLLPGVALADLLRIKLSLDCRANSLSRLTILVRDGGVPYQLYAPRRRDNNGILIVSYVAKVKATRGVGGILRRDFNRLVSRSAHVIVLSCGRIHDLRHVRRTLGTDRQLTKVINAFRPKLPSVPFVSLRRLFSRRKPRLILDLLAPSLSDDRHQLRVRHDTVHFVDTLAVRDVVGRVSILGPRQVLGRVRSILGCLAGALSLGPDHRIALHFLVRYYYVIRHVIVGHGPLRVTLRGQLSLSTHTFDIVGSSFLPVRRTCTVHLSSTRCFCVCRLLCD